MSINVKLQDEEAIHAAIKKVRDDANPLDWCLITHLNDGPNAIVLEATGNDGIEGLKSKLKTDKVQYALYRVTMTIDLSKVVRFAFIYNLGADVSFVKKGRFGVVKGSVFKEFQPWHVDFEINEAHEISEAMIIEKVQQAAGVANNVRDKDFVIGKQERGFTGRSAAHVTTSANAKLETSEEAPRSRTSTNIRPITPSGGSTSASKSSTSPTKPSAATQSATLQIAPELIDAIKAVHDDKNECRWVVAGYQDGTITNPVTVYAKAANGEGVDALKQHLKNDSICYALVRVIDVIEGISTVKFCFIAWIGNDVSVMKKARIGVHQGAIKDSFSPFHIEINASEQREISESTILSKVQAYSGSKSFVR